MCELLVRCVDKVNLDDAYADAKLTKKFDVICIQPDGWAWSHEERTAPFWRILKLPNVDATQLGVLLQREMGDERVNRMLQRRGHKLDLEHPSMPLALRQWWADSTRAQPTYTSNMTAAQLSPRIAQKPARPDPAVIG